MHRLSSFPAQSSGNNKNPQYKYQEKIKQFLCKHNLDPKYMNTANHQKIFQTFIFIRNNQSYNIINLLLNNTDAWFKMTNQQIEQTNIALATEACTVINFITNNPLLWLRMDSLKMIKTYQCLLDEKMVIKDFIIKNPQEWSIMSLNDMDTYIKSASLD